MVLSVLQAQSTDGARVTFTLTDDARWQMTINNINYKPNNNTIRYPNTIAVYYTHVIAFVTSLLAADVDWWFR